MVSHRPPFHRLQRVQKRRLRRPCDQAFALLRATASTASWTTWHTPSTSTTFTLNGLTFDAVNNRLLWAENSSPAGNTQIRASISVRNQLID
jgi:hypothetical protein